MPAHPEKSGRLLSQQKSSEHPKCAAAGYTVLFLEDHSTNPAKSKALPWVAPQPAACYEPCSTVLLGPGSSSPQDALQREAAPRLRLRAPPPTALPALANGRHAPAPAAAPRAPPSPRARAPPEAGPCPAARPIRTAGRERGGMAGGGALLRQCPLLLPQDRDRTAYEGFVSAQVAGAARTGYSASVSSRPPRPAPPQFAGGTRSLLAQARSRVIAPRRGRQLPGRGQSRRLCGAGGRRCFLVGREGPVGRRPRCGPAGLRRSRRSFARRSVGRRDRGAGFVVLANVFWSDPERLYSWPRVKAEANDRSWRFFFPLLCF